MLWNRFQFGVLRNEAEDVEDSRPGGGGSNVDEEDREVGVPDKGGKEGKDAGADKGALANIQKELSTVREQLRALETSERYWADKYAADITNRTPAKDEDEEEEVGRDEEASKVVDDFGVNGLEALKKRGVVTKKELDRAIKDALKKAVPDIAKRVAKDEVTGATNQLTANSKLAQDFPDLTDPKSELFARSREILVEEYGDIKTALNTPNALRMAARAAQAELGKGNSDREDRIRRQSGDVGRGRSTDEGDSDSLSAVQQEALASMKRNGVSSDQLKSVEKRYREQRGKGGR